MRRALGIGIVGMGFGAEIQLPAFLGLPGVRVVALADGGSGLAERAAAAAAAAAALPIRACAWRDLVTAPDVDLVGVATPPRAQAEVTLAALASGKHVLCEKPFGSSVTEAAAMCAAAAAAGRIGAVDLEFRFEPGIAELQRAVARGDLGPVRRIDVVWSTSGAADPARPWSWRNDAAEGGGALNAFASHVVDYVQWIAGARISRVSARAHVVIPVRTDRCGKERPVTAEDHCELRCDLESGATASITVSNVSPGPSSHRIEVHGERGRAVFEHSAPFTLSSAKLTIEVDGVRSTPPLTGASDERGDTRLANVRELGRRLVEAAAGGIVTDLPDFSCGLRVQRVLGAARRSMSCGTTVDVEHGT